MPPIVTPLSKAIATHSAIAFAAQEKKSDLTRSMDRS